MAKRFTKKQRAYRARVRRTRKFNIKKRSTKKIARVAKAVIKKNVELKWAQDVVKASLDPQGQQLITVVTPANNTGFGYCFTPAHVPIAQGTGGGSRIGNKLWLRTCKWTINLRIQPLTETDAVLMSQRILYRILMVKPKLMSDYTSMVNEMGFNPADHTQILGGTFGTTNTTLINDASLQIMLNMNFNTMNILYDSGVRHFNANMFYHKHHISWGRQMLQYNNGGANYPSDRQPYIFVFACNSNGTTQYTINMDWHYYVSFKDL